jgi:ribosome maturation protein SDO1
MSSKIFTPTNQVKLTNVAVVRLKKGGKRFEIACYKNKVADYKNKTTKDLDEVLQSRHIFLNVSKGQTAKDADLISGFGTKDVEKIILEILKNGEVQVGSEERDAHNSSLFREVATLVCERVVNPKTRSPYPIPMIEQAMREIVAFSPNSAKNAKQQALEVIKILEKNCERFPIARAQMRLCVGSLPDSQDSKELLLSELRPLVVLCEPTDQDSSLMILIESANYRSVMDIANRHEVSLQIVTLRDL